MKHQTKGTNQKTKTVDERLQTVKKMKGRWKYLLGIAMVFAVIISSLNMPVFADPGDDITWNFDSNTGVLTISGTGDMADNTTPWSAHKNEITSVVIEDGVTSIGANSFYFYTNITSVTIGKDVKKIGAEAFAYTYALQAVTIPNGVTEIGYSAFGGTGIDTIVIPDSVTTIGASAFAANTNLKNVTLPANITEIPESMFRYCSSLTTVTIPDKVTKIGGSAFHKSGIANITLPEGLKEIGEYAFNECQSLVNITLPNSLQTIDSNAFLNSKNLKSIVVPDNVTYIGGGAFMMCENLKDVTIGTGVKTIGSHAFDACTSLKDGTFIFKGTPESVGYSDTWNQVDSWVKLVKDKNKGKFSLPSLENNAPDGVNLNGYTTQNGTQNSKTVTYFNKSAKWANTEKTQAQLRFDLSFAPKKSMDVLFVLDYSSAMWEPAQNDKYAKQYEMLSTVNDINEQLLSTQGYNNRVGVVTYGSDVKGKVSFSNNSSDVSDFLFDYDMSQQNNYGANYTSGFAAASDMIKNRTDTSRDVIVVFMASGYHTNNGSAVNGIYAKNETDEIKALDAAIAGVVFDSTDQRCIDNVKAISSTPDLAYTAENGAKLSEAFDTILKELLLYDNLQDTINTDRFDLDESTIKVTYEDGGSKEISASEAITVAGDKGSFKWNIRKLKPGINYTLTATLHLKKDSKGQYHTGNLPTNTGNAQVFNVSGSTVNVVASPVLAKAAKYSVTTSVTGGTITPKQEQVEAGNSVQIDYSPKDSNYTLKSVTVDGVAQDINSHKRSYTFANIQKHHTIAVVYQKSAVQGKFLKTPNKEYVNEGDTVDYTISGFHNRHNETVTNYSIIDYIPKGLEFEKAQFPAFTKGKGYTYTVSYKSNKGVKVLHKNVDASKSFTVQAPTLANGEVMEQFIVKFSQVPEGFGVNDKIVYTFRVQNNPPTTELKNKAGVGYSFNSGNDRFTEDNTAKTVKTTQDNSTGAVNTGDTLPLEGILVLFCISVTGIAVLCPKVKRKKNEQ